VELTANHRGYFEFRLCPQNNVSLPVEQSCLDENLLLVVHESGGSARKYYVTPDNWFHLKVQLPKGLVCEQCVLQWQYVAGTSALKLLGNFEKFRSVFLFLR